MRVLITGISTGIGRALCMRLVSSGHQVWGVARRKNLLDSLSNELKSNLFTYSVCDISIDQEVEMVAAKMIESNFIPDTVVLNAGIEQKDLINNYQLKNISQEVFAVNYFGALKWVELFIDKFIERGSGKFIAISSIFAVRPDIDSVSYCSSKSALSMAFRSLHLRHYKNNIVFTNIYFGPVDTNISSGNSPDLPKPKSPFFIISPESASQCVIKAIEGKRSLYYYPLLTTLPIIFTFFLTDIIFYKLTSLFRR